MTAPRFELRRDLSKFERVARGIWRVADPRISLASVASLWLGTCHAAVDSSLAWPFLALTWLGVFCAEVAKNASGEVFDLATDAKVRATERTPFSGGKRVIVEGLLSPGEAASIAAVFYAATAACGLAIVVGREPGVLWLGLLGLAAAYFYNAPPLRLAYHGFGEILVALSYGPLIASGTYWVQTGTITPELLFTSSALGVAIAAFLLVNEFPDYGADLASGKGNWVVQLGKPRAAKLFTLVSAMPFVALLGGAVITGHYAWLAGFVGAPFAWSAAQRVRKAFDSTPELVPAQAWTLLAFCSMSAGLGFSTLLFS